LRRRTVGYRAPVGWTKLCPQAPARGNEISNVKEETVIKVRVLYVSRFFN
jgi:hypothetical protein